MNKIYFSKVFKGYSPEEVEAFIVKLNTDFQQKQQEFAAETKRLNNEIAEIKQRFEETLSTNERLVGENKDLVAANEKLSGENQELENQVRQLTQEKQELLDLLKAYEERPLEPVALSAPGALDEAEDSAEEVADLQEEKPQAVLKPEKPEILKSDDYRRLCEQMGEKLLIADKRAQEIINEARLEASKIVENAVEDANVEVRKLIVEAKKRAEIIYTIINEYEKKQVFISAGLEQARKHISEAISEVEALIASNKE